MNNHALPNKKPNGNIGVMSDPARVARDSSNWTLLPMGDLSKVVPAEVLADLTVSDEVSVVDATLALKALAGQDLTNIETGIVARVNVKQARKIVSLTALGKSTVNGFTAGQHNAAATNIDKLWKHAILLSSDGDRYHDPNIKAIKHFTVPVRFADDTGIAYLTVKESIENGHRIYSLELTDIKKLRDKGSTLSGEPSSDTTHGVSARELSQLWEVVNKKNQPRPNLLRPAEGTLFLEMANLWFPLKNKFNRFCDHVFWSLQRRSSPPNIQSRRARCKSQGILRPYETTGTIFSRFCHQVSSIRTLSNCQLDGMISAMSDSMRAADNHNRTSPAGGFSESMREKYLPLREFLDGEPISQLSLDVAPEGNSTKLREWAIGLFAQQGNKAVSPEIGEVVLDKRSVRDSIAHGGANHYKRAAFAVVKDVIEKGRIIHTNTQDEKNSHFIAAPVRINGNVNIVVALVRQSENSRRFYLHAVGAKESLLPNRVSGGQQADSRSTSSGDIIKILRDIFAVNPNFLRPNEGTPSSVKCWVNAIFSAKVSKSQNSSRAFVPLSLRSNHPNIQSRRAQCKHVPERSRLCLVS